MVEAPQKPTVLFFHAENGDAHQWILSKVKTFALLLVSEMLDVHLLFRFLHPAQVLVLYGRRLMPVNHLQRRIRHRTIKIRTKNGMPLHQPLDALHKSIDIHMSSQIEGCPFKICPCVRIQQAVE
ncbi:hypothetical protein D3C71_955680 [compost metagenome]